MIVFSLKFIQMIFWSFFPLSVAIFLFLNEKTKRISTAIGAMGAETN